MKENIFGIDVTVQTRAAAMASMSEAGGEPWIYGVIRCAERPAWTIPEPLRSRNIRTPCDGCRELCWYDPVHAIPGLRVLCNHCRPVDVDAHMTAEQLNEIRRMYRR
jgi:hypothetical protein